MLWLQGLLCFCIWVAYGVWLARTSTGRSLLPRRGAKVGVGAMALILGMVILVLGLYGVMLVGGLQNGTLTLVGFALVTIVGVAFVHFQAVGAYLMFRSTVRSETAPEARTSVRKEDLL